MTNLLFTQRTRELAKMCLSVMVVLLASLISEAVSQTPTPPATARPEVLGYGDSPGIINSVAWSPDGKSLVSGGRGDTVQVWDTERGELSASFSGHTADIRSVAWHPDGKLIIS